MNREYMIGNKIICQKLHKKQRRRHLSKLQEIKNRPSNFQPSQPTFFRQTSLLNDSQKIIEIERNNIVLFNRIASIIKQRPKMSFPKSREFVKSLDRAMFLQEKKNKELKAKQELYSRRISEQQPTIKNDIIFKERMQHERYLKFIGKYPFNPHRRTQTEFDVGQEREEQEKNQIVFHTKTLDFQIRISKNVVTNCHVFTIVNLADDKVSQMSMNSQKFREHLAECQYSYERIIGKLRMDKNGEMKYAQSQNREPSPTFSK